MAEWILSSSALILILLLLRLFLRRRTSSGLVYALWLLALVRLLLPFSIGESRLSLLNAVAPSPAYAPAAEATAASGGTETQQVPAAEGETGPGAVPAKETRPSERREWPAPVVTVPERLTRQVISWRILLLIVWIIGAGVVLVWTMVSNSAFSYDLRADRRPLPGQWAVEPKRIYISRAVRSPCLFGLFRPAIYVTPKTAADQQTLAHVLAHERAHYRHRDHIWGVLRVLALALHWYNPLVWLAAALSRQDAESAADASAIAALGEKERLIYGETLISLVQRRPKAKEYMSCGTTMFGSKRVVRERIRLIALQPHTAGVTLAALLLAGAVAVGCTFTGSGQKLFPDEEALRPVWTPKPSLVEPNEEDNIGTQPSGESALPEKEFIELVLASDAFADSRKYSYEEYMREFGQPLAEPGYLPEGYMAYDGVFLREAGEGVPILERLWYYPARQETLILSQYRENGSESDMDYWFVYGDELGRAFSGTWGQYRAGLLFHADGWTVSAQMQVSSGDREIECEKLCRSVTLNGQGFAAPAHGGETLVNGFSGTLQTVNGSFRFDAALYAQKGNRYAMYLSVTDSRDLTQRLDFPMPYSFSADTLDALWQAEDVDGDGSQDLLLNMGEYEGGPRAMCFVFDGAKNGYVPLQGFDRYIYLGFDRESGLICSRMGSGENLSYSKIRVVDGRMELCASLVIDRSLPEDRQYSEYGLSGGRLVPVQEKVPASAIDREVWYFADLNE